MNSSEHQPREEPSITILKSLERPAVVMKKGWGGFGIIHWGAACKLFLFSQSRLVEVIIELRHSASHEHSRLWCHLKRGKGCKGSVLQRKT